MASRPLRTLLLLVVLTFPLAAADPFLVKPYLQLGGATSAGAPLDLLWHAPDKDSVWSVEVQAKGGAWRPVAPPRWSRVAVPTVPPHRVYAATLTGPAPGEAFRYRVKQGGRVRFQAATRARLGPGQPQRVALLADLAEKGPHTREVACQLYRSHPDLVLMAGDLVYKDGRISEYRNLFFPAYNADAPAPAAGAPLLREVLAVGAIGNHDAGEYGRHHPRPVEPDALAYYLYWDQPGNGPRAPMGPALQPGPGWTWQPFLDAAGPRFPGAGSFSFDSGDAHFLVLDSNRYMHWEEPALRAWLERDLAAAQGALWRFVVFHHPPFNPDRRYPETWMGQLWPLFMRYKVDLVLTGHVHSYQRTRPLRFEPAPDALAALDPVTQDGDLKGDLTWDTRFDGVRETHPNGIIEVISGAGGSHLHYKGKAIRYSNLQPFLEVCQLDSFSFSLMDLQGSRLTFRQVDAKGKEVDRFILEK